MVSVDVKHQVYWGATDAKNKVSYVWTESRQRFPPTSVSIIVAKHNDHVLLSVHMELICTVQVDISISTQSAMET